MTESIRLEFAGRDQEAPEYLGELLADEVNISTGTTGSRNYLSGTIVRLSRTDNEVISTLFDRLDFGTAWVVHAGSHIRIENCEITWGRCLITCSQAHRVGLAYLDGVAHMLTVVEPSPPRAIEEWFPAERARAIRDLVGDGPRPDVQVPSPDYTSRVAFDPWAQELREGA
ncbi:hypothetical protein ACFWWS_36695 [Streptomyces sp. NPDC059083]|uniref:hypothetical protein n=1 Tax=Streptomyces sp. NPDC059083 TaxID=3346721 RepID=UPI00367FC903